MSGYVEAGYLVVLGSLGAYAVSLVQRERAARNRLEKDRVPIPVRTNRPGRTDGTAPGGSGSEGGGSGDRTR